MTYGELYKKWCEHYKDKRVSDYRPYQGSYTIQVWFDDNTTKAYTYKPEDDSFTEFDI